jgi:hypothetical protein
MCQRVYIASATELTTVRRGPKSPDLDVAQAPPDSPVRPYLREDLSYLYVAGGHVPCGCGFPDEPAEGDAKPGRVDEADRRSLSALVEHLRPACRKYATVQLYLCWAGQEYDAPAGRRSTTLDDLREAGFRLRHKQVMTVGRSLDPRRRRTRG